MQVGIYTYYIAISWALLLKRVSIFLLKLSVDRSFYIIFQIV